MTKQCLRETSVCYLVMIAGVWGHQAIYIIPLRSKLLFPYMNSGSYSDDYEFLDHFIEMLAKKNRKSTFLGK